MPTKLISWGILGTSFISQQMAQAIAESPDGNIGAVASRNLQTAQAFVNEYFNATAYQGHDALLADESIDIVYIGLPNHLHLDMILACLRAGKHVLCEKPLVLTEDEAEQVIEASKQADKFCMEAIMYRCHPLITQLQQIIADGALGKIHLYQASYTAKIAHLANPIGGGAINNLGCYPLSLIQYLAPADVSDLVARGFRHNQNPENDTQASALITFDDGSMATITAADDLDMSWQFVLHGALGRLEMITNPWLPERGEQIGKLYLNDQPEPHIITVDSEFSVYTYQINLVNQCIREPDLKLPERVELEESLKNIQVLASWRKQVLAQ